MGWEVKFQIKFLECFWIFRHQNKECCSMYVEHRTSLALPTTRNDPATLTLTPAILYWCLDTKNHSRSLVWNFTFQPSGQLIPPPHATPPRYWRTSSIFHVNLSYVSCLEANHQTEKKISKAFKGKVFIFEFPFRRLTAWLAWPACYSLCRLSYFNLTILVFDLVEKLFIIILL